MGWERNASGGYIYLFNDSSGGSCVVVGIKVDGVNNVERAYHELTSAANNSKSASSRTAHINITVFNPPVDELVDDDDDDDDDISSITSTLVPPLHVCR